MALPRSFVLPLYTALCLTGAAQLPPPAVLHKLDIPGLPAETVYDLDFDDDGFLWISTGNGLCRYDGVNLDVLRNNPRDTSSLPHNAVGRCLLLSDSRMLAGTSLGLANIDTRELTVQRIAAPRAWSIGHCGEIAELTPDARGYVLVSDLTYGLLRFDPATNSVERVYPSSSLPNVREQIRVHGVVVDPDGSLWVIDFDHLLHIAPDLSKMEVFPYVDVEPAPAPKPMLTRIAQAPGDPELLVIGSWGSGIITFNKSTRSFSTLKRDTGNPWNISNIVLAAAPVGERYLAIGLDWASYWYDPATRHLSSPFVATDQDASVVHDEVHAITADPAGRLWFAGTTGVYTSFDPQHRPLTPIARSIGNGPMTLARATDHAGYWAARFYSNRKLFALDASGNAYDSVPIPQGEELQVETWNILCTKDRRVYLRTSDGLLRYDPQRRSFTFIDLPYPDTDPQDRRHINDLLEAPNGDLWVSGHVYAFRAKAGTEHFEPFGVDTTAQGGWKQEYNMAFAWMDPDHLVIATLHKGISVVDLRSSITTDLSGKDPRAPELSGMEDVAATPDGWIYAITRNDGILRMRYADHAFSDIAVFKDPLERGNYDSAVADSSGTLWISSTANLVRFDPKDNSFTHYTIRDGMPSFGSDALVRDSAGTYLNKYNPWYRFDLGKLAFRPPPRALYIRKVLANGQVLPIPFDASTLELPHDRNSVAIEFACIDPMYADERRYEYQLDGYDVEWVQCGTQRTVSYAALAPGTYLFHARIAGMDGPQGRTELRITIVPAWWQTWWWKVLVVLAIGAAIFMLARYIVQLRYRQRIAALERDREISAVRTRIARDIHDDLGSGLTRITMLSRELRNTHDKEKLAGHIADSSSELIGQLSEIVWAVNPANDDAEHFIAYIRDQLGRQFEDLSIKLRTDLAIEAGQEHRDIPPDVKRNVLLILKETVSNALKHAQAKSIHVDLYIGVMELVLKVADDGRGFMPDGVTRGNGLGNLQKRASELRGVLHTESDVSGTRYELRVPMDRG
ncbi:MAG: hypothetical protein JNL43_03780 [Flavobacteriales bacterium]|nr:hypothetical protein [Flavobacteriales bacterium]